MKKNLKTVGYTGQGLYLIQIEYALANMKVDDPDYEECEAENADESFGQESDDEDCVILELVQPEEIEVAVPVPPTDDRMTKKKKQPTITDFFSKK